MIHNRYHQCIDNHRYSDIHSCMIHNRYHQCIDNHPTSLHSRSDILLLIPCHILHYPHILFDKSDNQKHRSMILLVVDHHLLHHLHISRYQGSRTFPHSLVCTIQLLRSDTHHYFDIHPCTLHKPYHLCTDLVLDHHQKVVLDHHQKVVLDHRQHLHQESFPGEDADDDQAPPSDDDQAPPS